MLEASAAQQTRAFLEATAVGYQRAAADPKAAAAALCACGHPSLADRAFVEASAEALAPKYLTSDGVWGVMGVSRWSAFVDFLSRSGILVDREKAPIARETVDAASLFTNEFLPSSHKP
tara:strand:+ start:842 stop:1198 length:357 start_codon:yes stop_codon:yes gene_type:complete